MRNVPLCLRPGRTSQPLPSTENQTQTIAETAEQVKEEKQTIVHCHFLASPGAMIRIWRSTFLIPAENPGQQIPLLHAENICFAPDWYRLEGYGFFTFSLIFAGLPADCSRFDLREIIDQPGAFFVPDISRNSSDVYHVQL
jgi:hypothetical protein